MRFTYLFILLFLLLAGQQTSYAAFPVTISNAPDSAVAEAPALPVAPVAKKHDSRLVRFAERISCPLAKYYHGYHAVNNDGAFGVAAAFFAISGLVLGIVCLTLAGMWSSYIFGLLGLIFAAIGCLYGVFFGLPGIKGSRYRGWGALGLVLGIMEIGLVLYAASALGHL